MQVINILGNHMRDFAHLHQCRNDLMPSIGRDLAEFIIHRKFTLPRFDTRGFAGQEVFEHNRCHTRPNPTRTAEIGNPTIRAHPSAGKYDDILTFFNPLTQNQAHARRLLIAALLII